MCGIIGYVGGKNAAPIILEGLKRLEYRGYDSAGIAVMDVSGCIQIKKDVGSVDEISKRLNFISLKGSIGLGHTRWATHGKVTKTNAHPHFSNNKKIVVVHNGIVENYQEIKRMLKSKGFKFYTETDTEVIPNLIELEMRKGKDFVQASMDAVKTIEGYYAIVAICEGEEKIVATKNGSPLVVGVSRSGKFVASDIPAFLQHTKKVVYVYDKDFIVLDRKKVVFYSLKNKRKVKRSLYEIDWSAAEVKKGNFNHFMMKEILEQVDTIRRASNQNKKELVRVVNSMKKAKGIFLVGCGSSYHACLSASYIFSKISRLHVNPVLASEFSNYKDFLVPQTLLVSVSQSGETIDVIDAVRTAREKGSKIVSILNVVGSTLHRNSDNVLLLNSGPEICVLSTKTYTAQIATLSLLAYTLANNYEGGKKRLEYISNIIYNLTSESARNRIKKLATLLKNKEHIFTIGRGIHYPTALEAALKIKEASYIHAEGFSGGELKHGNISLIEKGTPCIVFVSEENEKETISNAIEVKSRGGYIIGIGPKMNEVFDFWIKVPEAGELNPIVQIIPVQILAYQLAILRGCNPDKPRSLAKSVTVK